MLVGQLLGLIGIFLMLVAFQMNSRSAILRLQVVACLVWTAYYVFMGAFTAAGLISLGVVRSYTFYKYRNHEWLYGVIIIAYVIATVITWKDWTSALAFIGITLATTAIWQKNPRNIRMLSLTVTPFWLTYNLLNNSYMGAAADLITFASVAIAVMRFDVPATVWHKLRIKKSNETIADISDTINT